MIQDAAQIYAEQGFLTGIDLFSASEIGHFRACFDELEAREGREKCQMWPPGPPYRRGVYLADGHRLARPRRHTRGHGRATSCCSRRTSSANIPTRRPSTLWRGIKTSPIGGLQPPEAHTAWVAVDASDVENGCMRVIPGSHKNGIATHGESDRAGNLPQHLIRRSPTRFVDDSQAVDLVLAPGPDVHPRRPDIPRQQPQYLQSPPLRADSALHRPARRAGRAQLAGQQVSDHLGARRGPLRQLSRAVRALCPCCSIISTDPPHTQNKETQWPSTTGWPSSTPSTTPGIVPVFYNEDPETTIHIVEACARGGARCAEFTNRGDLAYHVFTETVRHVMAEKIDIIMGVGSICDAPTAALYIANGANFVVGPLLNEEVARLCNRRKIAYSPGCGSVSEIGQAEELGVEIVKVFPRQRSRRSGLRQIPCSALVLGLGSCPPAASECHPREPSGVV